MPKRATTYPIMLPVRTAGMSANRWLYGALRGQILEGRLRPGARVPGTRDLAGQYGLSRGTIVDAFDQLKSEGYLQGSMGSGTYVSEVLPDEFLRVHPRKDSAAPGRRSRRRHISDYARRVSLFPNLENRPSRAFRSNVPALDLFPVDVWAHIAARRLRRASSTMLLGCEPAGYRPLREAVADYLVSSRGAVCTADQVVILNGVQEAIDLAARLFLNPGDRVCMEDPGYTGASRAFQAAGATLSPARLDDEGITMGRAALAGTRLVYVTPGHQFPLGTTMSLRRRLELLEWARTNGALILEDDYDSEFRYAGRPIPALQGLDKAGAVLFAGSFNKVIFPSLRLGYVVVPPDLTSLFEAAISISRRHLPVIEQAVLCDFIAEGHFGRHLRRMREVYAGRLSTLIEAAHQRLQGLLDVSAVQAGLQTAGWLSRNVKAEAAAAAAALRNVEVVPLNRYSRRMLPREGLQLGFAAIDEKEIKRGVADLAIALEAQTHAPETTGRRR